MLTKELLLPVGQPVEHLSRTLVIADVSNLITTSQLLNFEDEGGQVKLGHLWVRPVPHILLIHLSLPV